ncbi:lysophospholipid acyltransferase family protein [Oricola sp.]|uniref:lysophospholipid acyltransferase family protein n=1 Tax=Oricola sp. TaxID=1979950 RepID=UPI0025D52C46|nr:lysophospholipid acyltransferase family protein [Oricola sp.]MCI5078538.1 lysophospholipid acyltransferase family protein [Oricola sp.]
MTESDFATDLVSRLFVAWVLFVQRTNRLVEFDEQRADHIMQDEGPVIVTCWHGQHFMAPLFTRNGQPSVAMVSRSRDAELNARIIERLGFSTVRASGGRSAGRAVEKGAIRGVLELRKHIRAGQSVFMMADIPHGTPRKAGMGIVSVARLSGAPIVPVAYASSRRRVFQKSWDKAVLNLPFGRAAFCFGDPIAVAADADDETMERCRLTLQDELNRVLDEAHAIVDADA